MKKHMLKIIIVILVLVLGIININFAASTNNGQVIEDGIYIIKSALNQNYVLDIYNNSTKDGANLELWTNNKSNNQKFIVKFLGNETYSIVAVNSKKSLDVEGNSKKAGTNVLQWTQNNQDNQKWIIKSVGNGNYKIVSKSSYLCLDIPYSKAAAGSNVQVWLDNGGKNQMFKFEKQETSSNNSAVTIPKGSKTVADGTYIIKSALNENCVFDIYNNSFDNNANLEMWTNNNTDNQKFTVKYFNDGTYTITGVNSEKNIDVAGAGKTQGTNVLQWEPNNQNNQKWIIKDLGNGNYNIISYSNGLYLDIAGAKAVNGANVQVWLSNGGKNQIFKFEKVVEDTTNQTIQNGGVYTIKSLIDGNGVLDVSGNSLENAGNIVSWCNNGGVNQKFCLNELTDGSYTISSIYSGLNIDVEGAAKKDGTNVLQWEANNQENQKWTLKKLGNGEYNIISKHSGLYLTIYNGNACVKNANNSTNQKFKFDNSNTVPYINTTKYPGYKERVKALIRNHPNWHFVFLYTGLDFNTVVNGECALHSRNLVPTSYKGKWICSSCGTKLYDSGWYCASKEATAYYMDPRNFLDENNVFQFQDVNQYIGNVCTLEKIQKQVNGTFLQYYARDIYYACRNKKVNAYYIISRLIQEQGRNGTTIGKGMDGGDGKTYYNPFNIGASGNGYSQIYANALSTAKKYNWNTMQKAIEGGIDFCKRNWLDNYQNTLYQNKFDIDTRNGTALYEHQYMQNLMGAYSESKLLKGMYDNINSTNSYATFIIPVYENMSLNISQMP